jgi:cell fate (sporulation/competence/biofilm development) regulator YmcA (YheA/YmcA/DUF963 family)
MVPQQQQIVYSQQGGSSIQNVPQQQIVYSQGIQSSGAISSTSQQQQYVFMESQGQTINTQPVVTQYSEQQIVMPANSSASSVPRSQHPADVYP